VPGQPAERAYSGLVALGFNGLVCAVRPAVEFCEWTAPLVITYYTVGGAHVSIAATFLHTASVPTASATGTRSTGTLLPVPGVRSHPTTATLTGSSAVYQTNWHSVHFRWRITRSLPRLFFMLARISLHPQRGQFTASLT